MFLLIGFSKHYIENKTKFVSHVSDVFLQVAHDMFHLSLTEQQQS